MGHLIDKTLRKSPFIALWRVISWGTARAEKGGNLGGCGSGQVKGCRLGLRF